jgi:hypothetical protein
LLESGSIQECAEACDADPTCVAFDRNTSGNCDGYKLDPLANFVGGGQSSTSWNCYTSIAIPNDCDSIYQDTIDIAISFASISTQYGNLQIEK